MDKEFYLTITVYDTEVFKSVSECVKVWEMHTEYHNNHPIYQILVSTKNLSMILDMFSSLSAQYSNSGGTLEMCLRNYKM